MKQLHSKHFFYDNLLIDFINKNNILKEDIVSIISHGGDYVVFYYS